MAQRRMFSKDITENDAFLDMPLSTQALYFHLGMQADDDGFVSPNRIVRMLGGQPDDLKILISKKFVLPFEDGVVVIKHWKINNYLRNDRYKETTHKEKLARLTLKDNNGYKLDTIGIPVVDAGKVSIGKVITPLSGTSNNNSMYNEPTIDADTGEEIIIHSGTFGKYTRQVAKFYCDLLGKNYTKQHLAHSKELLTFLLERYPKKNNKQLADEATATLEHFNNYYAEKNIKDWGIRKVIENYNKGL